MDCSFCYMFSISSSFFLLRHGTNAIWWMCLMLGRTDTNCALAKWSSSTQTTWTLTRIANQSSSLFQICAWKRICSHLLERTQDNKFVFWHQQRTISISQRKTLAARNFFFAIYQSTGPACYVWSHLLQKRDVLYHYTFKQWLVS